MLLRTFTHAPNKTSQTSFISPGFLVPVGQLITFLRSKQN